MNALKRKLNDFNSKVISKSIKHNEKEVNYYVIGESNNQVLLFLTGGSGIAEPFFEYCLYFSKKYKVISLNYPECNTLNEITNMIFNILKNEKAEDIFICGQSMGGIIAQVLLFKYPDLVKKIALCHTTTVTKQLQNYYAKKIKDNENNLSIIKPAPELVIKQATAHKVKLAIESHLSKNVEFWTELFTESIKKRTKQQLVTPILLMNDFAKSYCFNESSFKAYTDRVLIIDSDADKAFTTEQKLALTNIFKGSDYKHFKNESHMAIIESYDKYVNILDTFFKNN